MTPAEIQNAGVLYEAERKRQALEQQVALERARLEAQLPQLPDSGGGWDPPGVGGLGDYEF